MQVRRLVLLAFFAYVALDLGCPLVPGAFSFDPAESVDAVSAYRARPPALPRVAAATSAMSTMMAVRPFVGPVAHTPNVLVVLSFVGWRPHAGRDHALADPRPRIEDD